MTPYYEHDGVTLYLGDCREVLPQLDLQADCIVTDPPYGETSLAWDRWPDGWPTIVAAHTRSMWCFGSLRMFLDRRDEFAGWKMSQDIVWEKHNGSGFHDDRFKRVHENAVHWYQGDWATIHHETPTTADAVRKVVRRKERPPQMGAIERGHYVSEDGGPRLMRSVLAVRSTHGYALHPTQKPQGILDPLVSYACPPGGLGLDPMAGSGSTLVALRGSGRRGVGIEVSERYCEVAARRLDQASLFAGDSA